MIDEKKTDPFEPSNRCFTFYRDETVGIVHITGDIFDVATNLLLKEQFFGMIRRAGVIPEIRVLLLVAEPDALGEARYSKFRTAIAGNVEAANLLYREENALSQFARLVYSTKRIVVAGFGGSVIGQFLGAILAAEHRIAAASTVFSFPHVRNETPPPAVLAHLLPHYVGTARAWELMMAGESISATTASELGLINEVVPDEDLLSECIRKAKELAEISPHAMAMFKRSKAIELRGLDERCKLEGELQTLSQIIHDSENSKGAALQGRVINCH